jgi:hypothetical protein
MRRLPLIVLALALAGCGSSGDSRAGHESACAAAVSYHGMLYIGIGHHRDLPGRRAKLTGGRVPGCADHEGAATRDQPVELRRAAGISPAVAVYARAPFPGVYLNAGSFAELPGHPLHTAIYGSAKKPVWKLRGPVCAVRGTVADVGLGMRVRTAGHKVRVVHVDVRTRIAGFRRGGAPVLRPGDRVFVAGRCARQDVLAQRIRPLL